MNTKVARNMSRLLIAANALVSYEDVLAVHIDMREQCIEVHVGGGIQQVKDLEALVEVTARHEAIYPWKVSTKVNGVTFFCVCTQDQLDEAGLTQ